MTRHTISALGLAFICSVAFQGAALAVERKPVDAVKPIKQLPKSAALSAWECANLKQDVVAVSSVHCASGLSCYPKIPPASKDSPGVCISTLR
jgi:hypothetical protein